MLYDSYHKKISKVVDVLRKVFKHIVLISIVLGLLLAFLITFMVTKGMIIDDKNVSNKFAVTYGEDLPLKTSAMFASHKYQYSENGRKWSDAFPSEPGTYRVRAVAKGIFGNERYGKIYTFVLKAKEIDVSVVEDEIIYGELPTVKAKLSYEDTISCDGFVYEDRFSASTKVTPNAEDITILNKDGEDVTSSYEINVESTDINVLQREILVTVSDQSMIYNDVKFSYDGYELSNGTLADGDTIQAVFDKYLIDVGEIENTPQLKVVTSDGFDISMHYSIQTQIGKLKVDYRPLIIKTPSAEKVYDANALSNSEYEIVGEYGLVEGHTMICISNTSITDVDEVENVLDFEIKNAAGEDKTPNYSFFYERGMLKVTERPLNVSFVSGTWMYDNKWHKGEIKLEGLCEGHKATYDIPSIIDTGKIENSTEITEIYDAHGKDVFLNYDIIYGDFGTLEVTKRPITITTESQTLTYDGVIRVFDKYEITSEIKLADGEELQLTFNEFYKAGTYDNNIVSAMINYSRTGTGVPDENGWYQVGSNGIADAAQNYEITEVIGKIIINKCPITLRPVDIAHVYDGTLIVPTEFDIVSGELPPSHTIYPEYIGSLTDAGEIDTDIDLTKTIVKVLRDDGSEEDATENFEITVQKGKITISKRQITVRTETVEKIYDGTPLSSNNWEIVSETQLVEIHTLNLECNVSRIYPGESDNLVDLDSVTIIDENENDVLKNYEITYEYGKLIVHKRPITIVASSARKTYDGTPLVSTEYSILDADLEDYGLLEGHTLKATTSGSITNKGETSNKIDIDKVRIRNASNKNETEYYEITCSDGTLTIDPIIVNITTSSVNKIYDGTSINPKIDTVVDSDIEEKIIAGHTYSITVADKELINVKDSPLENEAILVVYDEKGADMTALGNYEVNGTWGSIIILPKVIKILPKPSVTSKVYDGNPLICTDYEDISNLELNEGLLSNHLLEQIEFNSQTDATDFPVAIEVIAATVRDEYGEDVTENYKFETTGISYEISKIVISITSHSDKKLFDGTRLTNGNYDLTGKIVSGQNLTVNITGYQLEEGKSNNTVESFNITYNGEDVTHNYDITVIEGTLEVYKEVVAKVTSTKDGYIYLKQKAYGDYSGRGFYDAYSSNYYLTRNGYNHNYMLWMSLNLAQNNFTPDTLTVKDAKTYMLPYYYTLGGNYDYPSYDSEEYTSNLTDYTVPYYDYDFYLRGTEPIEYRVYQNNYRSYTNWVKSEYTYISSSLKRKLLNAVANNGFEDMATEDAINAVARYMRLFGNYNLEYDKTLDSKSDVVTAFLTEYKEGVCTHYAMTATMLYRALGIPARYVEGYLVETKANESTDVKDAHAWVEVFVEGCGWVQIEVTPTGPNQEAIDILVKTKDESVQYDGNEHFAPESLEVVEPSDEVKKLIDSGYTVKAIETVGSLTYPGKIRTSVLPQNVRIYDEDGKDVTYKFNIETVSAEEDQGLLTVTPINIDIYLHPYSKPYDGKPIDYQNPDYSIIDPDFKTLVASGELVLSITFSCPEINIYTISANDAFGSGYFTYTITDKEGNDCSKIYALRIVNKYAEQDEDPFVYTVIEISKREIEIKAVSEERHYNEGDILSNPNYFITTGSLVEGHYEEVTITSELDHVGTTLNEIETCVIYDANGVDVTKNYAIARIPGILSFVTENEL